MEQRMENITITTDVQVYCVAADSFPEGVLKAHQTLHALVTFSEKRKYFGLSRMENGRIIYKAAAEELSPGELAKHGLESITLPAGEYKCIIVNDFMKNIQAISEAFNQLTSLPNIDPNGFCVEWYISNEDVRCMVRVV